MTTAVIAHHHTRPEAKATSFLGFPNLPAEIRHEIWHLALSESWSGTVYDDRRERREPTGMFRRQVSVSCREAQQIFRSRSVYMANFHMWMDVSCHIFYLRAPLCPRELGPAHHVVLNPVGWQMLFLMVEMVGEQCRNLRTIVIVAPWAEPDDLPADHTPQSWAPLEDWRMICAPHTLEEHHERLVYDIECSGVVEEHKNAGYHARLVEAVRRVPKEIHERDHIFGRLLIVLRRLDRMLNAFSGKVPRLFLRTASQLRAS